MSGNVATTNTVTCDDLRSYSAMIVKRGSTNNLRGGFAGDGEQCSVQITSHSDQTNADTNTKNYLRMHMSYGIGGTSTLAFTGVDNAVERAISVANGNVKIQGIALPTTDNDLANKAYADSKLSTYFNVNEPAKALVIDPLSGLNNWVPAGDGLSFVVDGDVSPFTNPSAGGVGVGTVDVDGITLTAGAISSDQRVLIINASGGANLTQNAAAMNGVYVLTLVTGVLCTFTRSADLDSIAVSPDPDGIQKGDYVLVSNAAATHHGMGFFLNSETTGFGNTDNGTNNQDWVQFASHTSEGYGPPIHNDADTVSIRGATNGSDENRPITAGAAITGQAIIGDRIGRADTAFIINGTANTLGESGVSATIATVVTTLKIPDLAAPGLSGGTTNITFASNSELKFDGTTHDNNILQEKCTVAKAAAGSTPLVLGAGTFKYDTVQAIGAVNIQTEGFDQGVTSIETGPGVLLDAVAVPVGFAGNDNEGRFYLSAYKIAGVSADECRFSIFNFNKSTHATLANKANPLVTFT